MTNQSTVRSDEQNPTETALKVQVSTKRRRLIKGAATVAPMILTLRSGSALAQMSGCYKPGQTTDALTPTPYSGDQVCIGTTTIGEAGTDQDGQNLCTGTIATQSAYTSLGPSAPDC